YGALFDADVAVMFEEGEAARETLVGDEDQEEEEDDEGEEEEDDDEGEEEEESCGFEV
ncbi:hypothetical protein BGZ54_010488, partial [Gamsiella multidivaricata]